MLRLVLVQGVALVVALGVLGLVAWWVLRLGVEPVNEMAHAAAAIAEGDLSHRASRRRLRAPRPASWVGR
ncbi:MAG: hypothetical protein R2699_13630 [Acidimicrobiales bacterium]